MDTLFRYILKWLSSKFLTLCCIIAILLVGLWFNSEWGEISKLLTATNQINAKISEKQTSINRLRQEVEQYGENAKTALADLDLQEEAAKAAWTVANKAKQAYQDAEKQVGWYQYGTQDLPLWLTDSKARITLKDNLDVQSRQAHEFALSVQQDLDKSKENQKASPWAVSQSKLSSEQRELEALQDRREELLESSATTPSQKLALAIKDVLPSALWILVGLTLMPPSIKALLYFWIAPMADKVAPTKILPGENNHPPLLRASGVSLDIEIKYENELLAHPDYLQSTAKSARKLTKWFLNHRLPFSSLASNMCLLTRIRAQDGQTEVAKISATKDPFGEVGLIDLPEGAAMVLYPRSLVAVVKSRKRDISITRHWRLTSLHSWLTLQFRYLVFHGPCQLVVKGCRGVCVEKPATEKPRLINQAATIGFSANLDYSNTRSEVFLSYLRGKDDLFNDLFSGENGVFIYEEMPDLRRKSGLTGRGIEGMTDALLKAFGV